MLIADPIKDQEAQIYVSTIFILNLNLKFKKFKLKFTLFKQREFFSIADRFFLESFFYIVSPNSLKNVMQLIIGIYFFSKIN
jgi:hypothetical protein